MPTRKPRPPFRVPAKGASTEGKGTAAMSDAASDMTEQKYRELAQQLLEARRDAGLLDLMKPGAKPGGGAMMRAPHETTAQLWPPVEGPAGDTLEVTGLDRLSCDLATPGLVGDIWRRIELVRGATPPEELRREKFLRRSGKNPRAKLGRMLAARMSVRVRPHRHRQETDAEIRVALGRPDLTKAECKLIRTMRKDHRAWAPWPRFRLGRAIPWVIRGAMPLSVTGHRCGDHAHVGSGQGHGSRGGATTSSTGVDIHAVGGSARDVRGTVDIVLAIPEVELEPGSERRVMEEYRGVVGVWQRMMQMDDLGFLLMMQHPIFRERLARVLDARVAAWVSFDADELWRMRSTTRRRVRRLVGAISPVLMRLVQGWNWTASNMDAAEGPTIWNPTAESDPGDLVLVQLRSPYPLRRWAILRRTGRGDGVGRIFEDVRSDLWWSGVEVLLETRKWEDVPDMIRRLRPDWAEGKGGGS